MQSANSTMTIRYKLFCLFLAALPVFCFAQENSPYSRYGIGNLLPQGNLANRAMGGISAATVDHTSLSSVNPASTSGLLFTTIDIGLEYDNRKLLSKEPVGSFKSNYGIISYLQVGFPLLLGNKNAIKNQTSWSMNFGLKPISRIDYSVEATSKTSFDSLYVLNKGDGGLNEGFIGTAVKIKGVSLGVNMGYLFGEKDYSTRFNLFNDSVAYQKTNYQTKTRYGGLKFTGGIQYEAKLKEGSLRFGAYGNLQQKYNASRDDIKESYTFDASGDFLRLDSISETKGVKGKMELPATYGFGVAYENSNLLIGADFETTNWSDYRFFDEKDKLQNSWIAKAGVQVTPAGKSSTGYFNYVKYRAGFSYGMDYIKVDNSLPVYTISVGGGFPLKLRRTVYDYQYSVLNIGFEYGSRGNSKNNITENTYRLSLGFSLSDMNWFRRSKYQ